MTIDGRYLVGAATGVTVGALCLLLAGTFTSAEVARSRTADTVVACEPAQQVILRHTVANGALQVTSECVDRLPYAGAARMDGYVIDPAPASVIRAAAPAVAPAPTFVRTQSPPRVRTPAVRTGSERSWKKTALVIGGSAGTGAGIGALAGGRKGALIGAAVGGGAASLYEAIKR